MSHYSEHSCCDHEHGHEHEHEHDKPKIEDSDSSFENEPETEKDLTKEKNGGVLKRILEKGPGWEKPSYESICKVQIKISSGDVIYEDVHKDVEVGAVSSTEGLDLCLEDMKKGEKSTCLVKAAYAYGEAGNEQLKIPPNTDIVYEIKLEDYTSGKEKWNMELEEKKIESLKRKNEGNEHFNQSYYSHALKKYKKALDIVEDDSKLEGEEKKKSQSRNLPSLPFKLCDVLPQIKEFSRRFRIIRKGFKN